MDSKKKFFKICALVGGAVVLYWLLQNFETLISGLKAIVGLASPLVIGFCIAFVLGVPLQFIERYFFPNTKKKWLIKIKRPVCIVVSLLIIIMILTLVISLVVPELLSAFGILANSIPLFFSDMQELALKYADEIPALEGWIKSFNIPWDEIGKTLFGFLKTGAAGLIDGTFSMVSNVFTGAVNICISFIFALYILLGKEKLKSQCARLGAAYFPEKRTKRIGEVMRLISQTFTKFIAGQCTEAVILGTLCWVGLSVFQFPYAPMIGALIGFTALIPVVGAFAGGFVGGFMIFMVDPIKTIWFIVFILVLQQLENNLIYPRVVGTSVGLPAMWVLTAVTIGGGLFGVTGMLFAVPTFSVIYTLVRENVNKRVAEKSVKQGLEEATQQNA